MKTFIHEEVYRGADLLKKLAAQPITLCGAGAIGSNLADNLVRQGFQKFTVIDMDRVEDHNRNSQLWTSRDVGQMKVAVLRNHLFNVMKVSIEPIDKKLDAGNVKKFLNILIQKTQCFGLAENDFLQTANLGSGKKNFFVFFNFMNLELNKNIPT